MFYKIHTYYKILSFKKQKYNEIINNIIKSKSYISYIDSKNNSGYQNPRYFNYLQQKQTVYANYITPEKLSDNAVFFTINPTNLTMDQIDSLFNLHGIDDDYIYDKELIYENEDNPMHPYSIIHKINLVEEALADRCLDTDELLESTDRRYLSEDFIFGNYNRFMLPPFFTKYNDAYLEPITIMNVYSEGIITLQIIVPYQLENNIELTVKPPMNIEFDNVGFYKIKENYKMSDFWERETKLEANINDVFKYYITLLKKTSKQDFHTDTNSTQYGIIISDLYNKSNSNHSSFTEQDKRVYYSYLTNSDQSCVNRAIDDNIDKYLVDHLTWETKDFVTYCNSVSALQVFRDSFCHNAAVEYLRDEEHALKNENLYKDALIETKKSIIFNSMFEFLRFYELTFIKKYFTRRLLVDLLNKNYEAPEDYNTLKSSLNYVKIKFDEELLFQSEGSPKELYNALLINSKTDSLLTKADTMLRNISDDIKEQRDLKIEVINKKISLFTSLLTAFLSFEAIDYIVGTFTEGASKITIGIWIISTIIIYLLYTRQG